MMMRMREMVKKKMKDEKKMKNEKKMMRKKDEIPKVYDEGDERKKGRWISRRG